VMEKVSKPGGPMIAGPPTSSSGAHHRSTPSIRKNQVANEDDHHEVAKKRGTMMSAQHLEKMEVAKKLHKETHGAADKAHGPKSVFPSSADMKAKVKESIMKPEYNVHDFYKKHGVWQMVARSTIFDNLTLCVIGMNALWISIDTDLNDAETLSEADVFFQVGENSFCVYFTVELLCRFMSFQAKSDCVKDGWFVFDSMLVFMMVVETWLLNFIFFAMGGGSGDGLGNASILRLVRLLRLTRMARMVRLLRAMPELMILVKGISVATRSVFFTLCLLGIFIYVFAIAFTQLAKDTDLERDYFPNVPEAMNSLLLSGTLPDQAEFVLRLGQEHVLFAIIGMFFILLTSLTVLNMLVGVLCEVVSVVSSVEKETMTVQFVKSKLLSLIKDSGIDKNGDKYLSKAEFEALLLVPEGARIIEEVGVDVVGLVDFTDDIFKDGIELSFHDFMELVLQLRSNNNATVRDIVDLRKHVDGSLRDLIPVLEQSVTVLCAEVTCKMKEATDSMMLAQKVAQAQAAMAQPVAALENGNWSQNPQPQVTNDGSRPSTGKGPQRPFSAKQTRPGTTDSSADRPLGRRPASGNPRCRSPSPGRDRALGAEKPEVVLLPTHTWMTQYDDEAASYGETISKH